MNFMHSYIKLVLNVLYDLYILTRTFGNSSQAMDSIWRAQTNLTLKDFWKNIFFFIDLKKFCSF